MHLVTSIFPYLDQVSKAAFVPTEVLWSPYGDQAESDLLETALHDRKKEKGLRVYYSREPLL